MLPCWQVGLCPFKGPRASHSMASPRLICALQARSQHGQCAVAELQHLGEPEEAGPPGD